MIPRDIFSGFYHVGNKLLKNSDQRQKPVVSSQPHTFSALPDWQTSAGSTLGWSGWASLAGNAASTPAVGTNADGRLEIFAQFTDNSVEHAWEQTAAGSSSWVGWTQLSGGGTIASPSVTRDGSGNLGVAVVGGAATTTPFYAVQMSPGGSWSGWLSLGGGLLWAPTASTNSSGLVELLGVGGGNAGYRNWQIAPPPPPPPPPPQCTVSSQTFTIGGQITESGEGPVQATVVLSGTVPTTPVTSGSNGKYVFVVAGCGNYTVTPSIPGGSGYTVSPTSFQVNSISQNYTMVNFVLTPTNPSACSANPAPACPAGQFPQCDGNGSTPWVCVAGPTFQE